MSETGETSQRPARRVGASLPHDLYVAFKAHVAASGRTGEEEIVDAIYRMLHERGPLEDRNRELEARVALLRGALAPFVELAKTEVILDAFSFGDADGLGGPELKVSRGFGGVKIWTSAFAGAVDAYRVTAPPAHPGVSTTEG
jgi:hypothetical protein